MSPSNTLKIYHSLDNFFPDNVDLQCTESDYTIQQCAVHKARLVYFLILLLRRFNPLFIPPSCSIPVQQKKIGMFIYMPYFKPPVTSESLLATFTGLIAGFKKTRIFLLSL